MTTHVLIGGELPRVLRDIAEEVVGDEPDIEVAVVGRSMTELSRHVAERHTDLVILGCSRDTMDRIGEQLLSVRRRLRVLAVDSENFDGVLFSLTPARAALGELSTLSLQKIIRGNGS